MSMTNCACQCIRRITAGRTVKRQQSLHHRLHLALIGAPKTHHCLLDTKRGVLVNDEPFSTQRRLLRPEPARATALTAD